MATRIVNRLPQFVSERQRRGARAMTQALVLGAQEASVLTPIGLTSNLINSQYRDVRSNGAGGVIGTVGYTADYALPVHDPNHHQTFRRPSAEKEFLTKGFERARPEIERVIKEELNT